MSRAYLIDPAKKSITEIDLAGDNIEEIYRVMDCHRFTTGSRPLNGSMSEGFDTLYADDTDLLEPGEDRGLREHWQEDPKDWYQVDADRNPPSSLPLSGRGLVVGVDEEGARCDARISLTELRSRIIFTRRKFHGFDVATSPSRISVTASVPLIDGENEGTKPARPDSWNAKMPLSGQPLITDDHFSRLMLNEPPSLEAMASHDPVPVVKIFLRICAGFWSTAIAMIPSGSSVWPSGAPVNPRLATCCCRTSSTRGSGP